jgi:hypothetical protein
LYEPLIEHEKKDDLTNLFISETHSSDVLTVRMPALQSRIDDAFYRALSNASSRLVPTNDAPGGFVLDDDDELPGGFLPPSPSAIALESGVRSGDDQSSYIPLSRIPYALQLLDLPPDDEEVLSVFHNAATGWGDDQPSSRRAVLGGSSTGASDDKDIAEERVSLRDWRAVCNALMDDTGDDEDNMEGNGINDDEDPDVAGECPTSEPEESSGGSSDEYRITNTRSRKAPRKSASAAIPGSTRKTRTNKTQSGAARRRSSPSRTTGADITPRQRRECLQTFLLFFPGMPEEVAKHRRLGVREVNAAATVLNEKIKTEEVRSLTLVHCTISRITVYRLLRCSKLSRLHRTRV